jgi:hypothetical protein
MGIVDRIGLRGLVAGRGVAGRRWAKRLFGRVLLPSSLQVGTGESSWHRLCLPRGC